ncbi:MAG: glycosyltransferase family 8 protein [Candidatus Limiplasma sp.]|nr:glycosyltransferase family 8 protein [Candidatus Limiplasma sp.]
MNILVTLNANYIRPLKVMLWSLFFNNPEQSFNIYLLHSSLMEEDIDGLHRYITQYGQKLHAITIQEEYFKDAPVILHYTKEMYYRLLAYRFLPVDVDKILYLDPDILIINPIKELYDTQLDNYLYAAAYHDAVSVKELNRFRLKAYEMEEYFNSGVLMMNLALQRDKINEEDIYAFVARHKNHLYLPDQDILNALYSKEIKKIDELKYNYDARYYQYNKILSNGTVDMEYVMRNTSILHFCGKKKPWHSHYNGKFCSLYKHYETLASRKELL